MFWPRLALGCNGFETMTLVCRGSGVAWNSWKGAGSGAVLAAIRCYLAHYRWQRWQRVSCNVPYRYICDEYVEQKEVLSVEARWLEVGY